MEEKEYLQQIATAVKLLADTVGSPHKPLPQLLRELNAQTEDNLGNIILQRTQVLADNQQAIYDAMQASIKELTSQNDLLRQQLSLIVAQNRFLQILISRNFEGKRADEFIAAVKATDEAAAKLLTPSNPAPAPNPFDTTSIP